MLRRILFTGVVIISLFSFTGCDTEVTVDMTMPEIEITGENNPFPPEVYEYTGEDTVRIIEDGKEAVHDAMGSTGDTIGSLEGLQNGEIGTIQ